MTGADPTLERRVLVHAMIGADAAHTARMLTSVGVTPATFTDAQALCRAIEEGAGAVFLAEESLLPATTRVLMECLERQPPWSDLPIVVSVVERELVGAGYGLVGSISQRANVTLLERPVNARAMIAAVQSALRARRRQYEARALFEELGRARDLAEANSRARDEFLATLSHELRTPLNAILGWTRMLRSDAIEPRKRARALATVERNAVAQTQLIEDLLDVSRAASGKLSLTLQSMDPASAVRAAIDAVRPSAEAKHIEIECAIDPDAGSICGDPDRLEQVLWNLLNNAIKFTPDGGHVSVTLGRRQRDVEITVTDDGPGIPPEFLPFVFERFRQADATPTRKHGGLGIGLSIVKSIVELHRGTVTASSPGVGRGSTFRVHIPSLRRESEPAPPPEPHAETSRLRTSNRLAGLRVLVVDDEAEAVELFADVLTSGGATVLTAASAAAGFDELVSQRPDVLVSDLGMRDEDGLTFIRRVRSLLSPGLSRIPALAVTAYARVEDRTRALVAGFDMHVAKPVEPAELVSLVEMLARQFGARAAAS